MGDVPAMTPYSAAKPRTPPPHEEGEKPRAPLRIVFDSGIFLERHFGGVMRYVRELANGLAAELANHDLNGRAVQVMAGLNVAPLAAADFPAGSYSGVRLPPIRGAARLYRSWNDRRLSIYLRNSPDIPTIFHETLYGAAVDVPRHVRRIVTVHDLIWENDPAAAPPLGLRLKASSIAAAHGVIFVSESTRQAFTRHYPLPRQWAVIHHGSELRTTRSRQTPRVPMPFMLYVGQRQGYKNWEAFVRALADSPLRGDIGLVMFGSPPSRREMAAVAALGDTGKGVAWLEGDDDVLADLYSYATCLVYPSLTEGFGMPLMEAARLGCPVACSDIRPFREIMGPHAAYFNPDDDASIGAAVAAAVVAGRSDPRVLAAARQSADFSWRSACQKTLDFYRQVHQAA